MRANDKNGNFCTFSIEDAPVLLNNYNEYILCNRNNSPIVKGSTFHIGDRDTGFFVGDIVSKDGVNYLISYERGFYGISENYVRCHLDKLRGCDVVSNYFTNGYPIKLQVRRKFRFKYKDITFTLNDLIGIYEGKILTRLCNEAMDVKEISQDVGIIHNGKRLYLGDEIPEGIVELHDGRIVAGDYDLDRKEIRNAGNN